jgi:O-antigen/teichoic acid export membrane protein
LKAARSSYARGARVAGVGIAATALVTQAYFSLASHQLSRHDYGGISLLWSAIFLVCSVLYRPVEQMLSRSIADRDTRGIRGNQHLRVAAIIQLALAAVFLAVALALRGPLQDDLFGGASALYWVLVIAVPAYAASYFARVRGACGGGRGELAVVRRHGHGGGTGAVAARGAVGARTARASGIDA